VELELSPEQPPEVVRALSSLVPAPNVEPDPWWRAGNDEALYGETTARPRSTLGADLA
jgi:hypothetical protein